MKKIVLCLTLGLTSQLLSTEAPEVKESWNSHLECLKQSIVDEKVKELEKCAAENKANCVKALHTLIALLEHTQTEVKDFSDREMLAGLLNNTADFKYTLHPAFENARLKHQLSYKK